MEVELSFLFEIARHNLSKIVNLKSPSTSTQGFYPGIISNRQNLYILYKCLSDIRGILRETVNLEKYIEYRSLVDAYNLLQSAL